MGSADDSVERRVAPWLSVHLYPDNAGNPMEVGVKGEQSGAMAVSADAIMQSTIPLGVAPTSRQVPQMRART